MKYTFILFTFLQFSIQLYAQDKTVFIKKQTSVNTKTGLTDTSDNKNEELIFGTVKDGITPVVGAIISLSLPWTSTSLPFKNITKITNSKGEYFYTAKELEGYTSIASIELNPWENNNTSFYPLNLTNISIPLQPEEYNFNSQLVTPEIIIKQPNKSSISNNIGSTIPLEALIDISYDDGITMIKSVFFKVDNTMLSHTNNATTYTANWQPTNNDYGKAHTFSVQAESSNGEIALKTFDFTLHCTDTNCSNLAPTIKKSLPKNTRINQVQKFQNIPIEVAVTNFNGAITSFTYLVYTNTNSYDTNFSNTRFKVYPNPTKGILNTDDNSLNSIKLLRIIDDNIKIVNNIQSFTKTRMI